MVLETDPRSYLDWLGDYSWRWLAVMAAMFLFAVVVGFLKLVLEHGPGPAADRVFAVVAGSLGDLFFMSPRRVLAIAGLSIREAMRRKVLVGFAVFAVVLMFAVWFLDEDSVDPVRLYTDFVLWAVMILAVVMGLFMSVFSLPNDMKQKTIYTVVTKPVRPSEIVLGRILGFTAVGTLLLLIMGACSYAFVVRTLNHTHVLSAGDLQSFDLPVPITASGEVETPPESGLEGWTQSARAHRHRVRLDSTGDGVTATEQQHYHHISRSTRGGQTVFTVGPPEGQYHARVPHYGRLSFYDRSGELTTKGINVGNIWTYRSYLAGGTQAKGRWTFNNVRASDFPDGLQLEMTIRVFRTRKGNEDQGIPGRLVLRNPYTGLTSADQPFIAKEFYTDQLFIPRSLQDANGRPIDLFQDLVYQGQLEVDLQCIPTFQFFGIAQGDIYLLPKEGSFTWNYAKGYFGIWLQMTLVITFGVMWSTFLNGPVSLLAMLGTVAAGFFMPSIEALARGESVSGGTIESGFRLVSQTSAVEDLEATPTTAVIEQLDRAIQILMEGISRALPNLRELSNIDYVSSGFNIPADELLIQATMAFSYALPAFICGLVFLKLREVAK